MPVGNDVLIVLFKIAGKAVMSGAVGDKIKKVCRLRMKSRFQRAFSGIADRAWRKSGEAVSIVRRIHGKVGVMKRALIGAVQ